MSVAFAAPPRALDNPPYPRSRRLGRRGNRLFVVSDTQPRGEIRDYLVKNLAEFGDAAACLTLPAGTQTSTVGKCL